MKKLLALLLALVMIMCLAACGGSDASADTEEAAATEEAVTEEAATEEAAAEEEPAEPEVQEVTVGDYHVVYESAILYKPFESDVNPPVIVVYFSFTNNSSEACMPYLKIYCPAVQGGENLEGVRYANEKDPVEWLNYQYNECPAGETVRCAVMYNITEGAGNVDVTFMDSLHEIEDQLVVSIDPTSLELVTEPLGVAE